jgi:hypothetical protein
MIEQDATAELTVAKCEQLSLVRQLVEKQGREGLVPKKVQVNREGKTFTQTVFIRPRATGKLNDLAGEAWGHMNVDQRLRALGNERDTQTHLHSDWNQIPAPAQKRIIEHLQQHYPESVKIEEPKEPKGKVKELSVSERNKLPIKIVGKRVTTKDWKGNPILWRITFQQGDKQWFGDMGKEELRAHELRELFREKGVSSELISELEDMAYERGQESTRED